MLRRGHRESGSWVTSWAPPCSKKGQREASRAGAARPRGPSGGREGTQGRRQVRVAEADRPGQLGPCGRAIPLCLIWGLSWEAGRQAWHPKKEACGLVRRSYFYVSALQGQPQRGGPGAPGSTAQVKAGGQRSGRAPAPTRGKQPPHTSAPYQTQPLGPRGPVMEEMGKKAFVSEAWVWWAVRCLKGAWWCWGANAGDGDTPE